MKFDYRLIKAMKAYDEARKRDNMMSINGEVPKSQQKFVRRIHRWVNYMITSEDSGES
jgi:hypothetical protein